MQEEWELNAYVNEELGKGVLRAFQQQTREEGWGEQKDVDESDIQKLSLEEKTNNNDDDKAKSKRIIIEHDEATKILILDLKNSRKVSHDRLKERLAKRRKEAINKVNEGARTEEEADELMRKLDSEEIKERVLNDRLLTLAEHKAIEEHGQSDADGINMNTYQLLDEIHEEYGKEREEMQKLMAEEKVKRKDDLAKKRKERKENKERKKLEMKIKQGASLSYRDKTETGNDMKLEDINDDDEEVREKENNMSIMEEVDRISKQHAEERETLEMMNIMEQTRQKQALQQRLLEKKRKKKKKKKKEELEDEDEEMKDFLLY